MKRLTILSCLTLMAALVPAQANTYYFQTTGSDSNQCTFAKPCRSFASTYLEANVAVGDTLLALDSVDFTNGGMQSDFAYAGLTIDGGEHGAFMVGAFFATGTFGMISSGANQPFVMRNITVVASPGNAGLILSLSSGGAATLENVTIVCPGLGAIGILGNVSGGAVIHLKGVTILGQGTGVQIANQSGAPFSFAAENLLVDMSNQGAVLTDGYGVIRNSQFRSTAGGATGLALLATTSTPTWMVDTCAFQNLAFGMSVGGGSTARISNSEFTGNGFGIFSSGTTISFRNNVFAGNGTDGSPILTTSLK